MVSSKCSLVVRRDYLSLFSLWLYQWLLMSYWVDNSFSLSVVHILYQWTEEMGFDEKYESSVLLLSTFSFSSFESHRCWTISPKYDSNSRTSICCARGLDICQKGFNAKTLAHSLGTAKWCFKYFPSQYKINYNIFNSKQHTMVSFTLLS